MFLPLIALGAVAAAAFAFASSKRTPAPPAPNVGQRLMNLTDPAVLKQVKTALSVLNGAYPRERIAIPTWGAAEDLAWRTVLLGALNTMIQRDGGVPGDLPKVFASYTQALSGHDVPTLEGARTLGDWAGEVAIIKTDPERGVKAAMAGWPTLLGFGPDGRKITFQGLIPPRLE